MKEIEVHLALMDSVKVKYIELTVRLHTAGEVWDPRLPRFMTKACMN